MEQIITDSLGTEITLTYDETTDKVMVLNPVFDADFCEVGRLQESKPDMVIIIEKLTGEDSWETWSDHETRSEVVQFWMDNKKNQE